MEELSEIEKFIIKRVKEIRIEKKMSQKNLSLSMGFSEGFVGNIENPNLPEKYNIKHLNLLAKALGCSPKDFMPEKSF